MEKTIISTTRPNGFSNPETWEVSVDRNTIYTNDDVINAYLKGKDDGIKANNKLFIDKLNENIEKSTTYTTRMIAFLKQRNLTPISAHLKIKAYNDFVILVTLPEDEFISEEFLVSYDFASTIEEEVVKDEYYNVMFMFSDREEEGFNKNLLASDGFFLDFKMDSVNG